MMLRESFAHYGRIFGLLMAGSGALSCASKPSASTWEAVCQIPVTSSEQIGEVHIAVQSVAPF